MFKRHSATLPFSLDSSSSSRAFLFLRVSCTCLWCPSFVTLFARYITRQLKQTSSKRKTLDRKKEKLQEEREEGHHGENDTEKIVLLFSLSLSVGDRFWEQKQVLRADSSIFLFDRWKQHRGYNRIEWKRGTNTLWTYKRKEHGRQGIK